MNARLAARTVMRVSFRETKALSMDEKREKSKLTGGVSLSRKQRVTDTLLRHGGTVALALSLAASLGLNIVLGWQLRTIPPQPRTGGIQADALLPRIDVRALDGSEVRLGFSNPEGTILYVLSPFCGWCVRNYENAVALAEQRGPAVRMVGVSITGTLEELREHLRQRPLPFEVYLIESADLVTELDFDATPQTALLDAEGRVKEVWVGAYLPETEEAIEGVLGVELPGLTGAPRSQ